MLEHLRPVLQGDAVALRCTACGATCPVPASVSVAYALDVLLALHPPEIGHEPSCPDWAR